MEKYLDKKLDFKSRAIDLVSKMTIEEKAGQLLFDAPAIERLKIPAYNYWNEALHGLARSGTATVFPQAIALASMFDEEELYKVADIISTETRAKFNAYQKQGDTDIYKGLTLWSPNVNIFRDPRWGRGQETYGEDPYLTARLGVAFVKGLQGSDKYLKTSACAKHYAVHSGPEDLRHVFDAVVNKKDLFETYLPQFEALVKESQVESFMGAYNRTNGEVCCASNYLMNDILRGEWKFDGHFVSDFGALSDFHLKHKITKDAVETTAKALKAGCDINAGYVYKEVMNAYNAGLITEKDMDTCLHRVFATRIKLGLIDGTVYDKIPYNVVDCKEHRNYNRTIAEKTMVLLKNDGLLPLNKKKVKTLGVIGNAADSVLNLKSNYYGTCGRATTFLRGIEDYVGDDIRVLYSEGCHKNYDRVENLARPNDRISEAVTVAENSDVVVLCLGLDETLEGEELHESTSVQTGDKIDLNLPQSQMTLLEKVLEVGTPVVLILSTGSAMTINLADEKCNAIIQAWYPGSEGGNALAKTLFGESNPSAKLPITFYKTVEELPPFVDYNMKNRTYKFMENDALYPFGYGLSYTKFEYSNLEINENLQLKINVKNIGKIDGDEVVQVYAKILDKANDLPKYSLVKFTKVNTIAGKDTNVVLQLDRDTLCYFNEDGSKVLASNVEIFVGGSQPDNRSIELTKTKVLSQKIKL